jgi:PAS domain S-box-containing protein
MEKHRKTVNFIVLSEAMINTVSAAGMQKDKLRLDGELVRAGARLAREQDFTSLAAILVEQAQDVTGSDLAAFYVFADSEDPASALRLVYRRGRCNPPDILSGESEMVLFLRECGEALIYNGSSLHEKKPAFLAQLLLVDEMQSGIGLPIRSLSRDLGVLFVNFRQPYFVNRERFFFLDAYAKLAGGVMQTSRLFGEMKEYLRKIEELQRYQENVFNSMTSMIITTDPDGCFHYFNRAAADELGLDEEALGKGFAEFFKGKLSSKTLKTISAGFENSEEILNLKGIYKGVQGELDYSLNVTPLTGKRGKNEGLTLLFTNQTRENELKSRVKEASEERRVIKDMFCRYMSADVVSNLMEFPDSIKLGGDKRIATVFFADIRGYTNFSEGRDPSEIIEILNEYFSDAVERVIKCHGYIDKFIGDCIMAVWGVPLAESEDDAVNAVSCALAIQRGIQSSKRRFFRKEAASLKVGIGINTGPLVAGNLGSLQRMDYSVIGDTVNLAARLEGVAGPDEIIISRSTRDKLGDAFRLEKLKSVQVKGKEKPIEIYNVLGEN